METSTSSPSSILSIKQTFTLPPSSLDDDDDDVTDKKEENKEMVVQQVFDSTSCKTANIGLEEGVEPFKPKAGDYSYSGTHDQGNLPPPKEGGDYAFLISCVNEARKSSDALLTRVIEHEKNKGGTTTTKRAQQPKSSNNKKPKVDGDS